jgi:hypothetical protein
VRPDPTEKENALIVRSLSDIEGTARETRGETFLARRILLASDGMGYSFHDTTLYAGTKTDMHYKNHLESVYCVEGKAETAVELFGRQYAAPIGVATIGQARQAQTSLARRAQKLRPPDRRPAAIPTPSD